MDIKNFTYYGNSAYCYSNSTAMLLASIGETISPSLIESVGGVGIGAFVLPESNIAFLSDYSGLPDIAISKALTILGFEYKEGVKDEATEAPFEELERMLVTCPVILGPLDMGYLNYNPNHKHLHSVDHFVLVYAVKDGMALLHDPAGFPNASISLNELASAWKAESIGYKRGYYRYWTSPRKVSNPTDQDIYKSTIKNFQEVYQSGERYGKLKGVTIDIDAIDFMAGNIGKETLKPPEVDMLTSFIFPLGARRANDMADFFLKHDEGLSILKSTQAKLLGLCHSYSVYKEWKEVAQSLRDYAQLESKFKEKILKM